MTTVRRFLPDALDQLQADFERFERITSAELQALLADDRLSRAVSPSVSLPIRPYTSRLDLAAALWVALEALHQGNGGRLEHDDRLWAWLALAHLDEIAPMVDGYRKLGERAKWLPERRTKSRHVMAGPFIVFSIHYENPSAALAILGSPLGRMSKVANELSQRRDLLLSPAVMELATRLFYDPVGQRAKPGAATAGPGGIRRFVTVMMQLDVVWDLQSISTDRLAELLPPEFDRWSAQTSAFQADP